jgi:flagellar biosynthesis/type III secretory pathway chaperone
MNSSASDALAELLRAELAAYGGLLSFFDRQQAALLKRDAAAVLEYSLAIERLAAETAASREARELHVAALARAHGRAAAESLRRLLDLFPADQRPLLDALMEEINRLLQVVRRRARQNHAILVRAVELRRELLATVRPDALPRTYAAGGQASRAGAPLLSTLGARA